jgi:hypothetical protein
MPISRYQYGYSFSKPICGPPDEALKPPGFFPHCRQSARTREKYWSDTCLLRYDRSFMPTLPKRQETMWGC